MAAVLEIGDAVGTMAASSRHEQATSGNGAHTASASATANQQEYAAISSPRRSFTRSQTDDSRTLKAVDDPENEKQPLADIRIDDGLGGNEKEIEKQMQEPENTGSEFGPTSGGGASRTPAMERREKVQLFGLCFSLFLAGWDGAFVLRL
jgi:hypothetical protein